MARILFIIITVISSYNSVYSNTLQCIIDTDVDFDDICAICYLANKPGVDIHGITVEGHGYSRAPYGINNLVKILHFIHRQDIPVFQGATFTLSSNPISPPKQTIDACNKLWDISLPPINQKPLETPAYQFIIDTLQKSPFPISIIALGPLTNIALALEHAPEIRHKIDKIYFSAHFGPIHKYPSNIQMDPLATLLVINYQVPLVLVTELVTHQYPVNEKLIHSLNQENATGKFLSTLLQAVKYFEKNTSLYIWDAVTALVATHPQFVTSKNKPILLDFNTLTPQLVISKNSTFHAWVITYTQPACLTHTFVDTLSPNLTEKTNSSDEEEKEPQKG